LLRSLSPKTKEFIDLYSRMRKGAIGEEMVGRVLADLEAAGYESLHGLDRSRGDIDHVVIGPTGVTVIETKAWRGRIYLGRSGHLMNSGFDKHRVIRRCERTAGEIHGVLAKAGVRTWVDSCVVLTASPLPKGPMKLGVIDVLTLDALPGFIEGRCHPLTPQEISAAREALLDAFN
jgi:Nuclease-related domain